MLLLVEIREILSWIIFGQILEKNLLKILHEIFVTILGNFREQIIMKITENYREILRKCRQLLRKFCITCWENFKRICEKLIYKEF